MMRYHRTLIQRSNSTAHFERNIIQSPASNCSTQETNNGKPPPKILTADFNNQLGLRSNPKQIASIICNEFGIPISQQTIYRYIWEDRNNGGKLYKYLRRKVRKSGINQN